MKEMKSDADIMHESREYIRQHGWTQGTMVDTEGRVCGYGAVAKSQGWFVMDEDTRCQPTCRRILAKVLVAIGHAPREAELELSDFTTWNDDFAESQQQVEDAFAKAEKIERAGFDPDAS
jgi:hypothetical protein